MEQPMMCVSFQTLTLGIIQRGNWVGRTSPSKSNRLSSIRRPSHRRAHRSNGDLRVNIPRWQPETTGRPLLKIVAKDGEGERANIDFMSRNLVVEAPEDDMRGLLLGAASLGFVFVIGLVALLISRRRRAQEELELLTSWDAFKSPSPKVEPSSNDVPTLEGNAMDGTEEVQAELDLDVE